MILSFFSVKIIPVSYIIHKTKLYLSVIFITHNDFCPIAETAVSDGRNEMGVTFFPVRNIINIIAELPFYKFRSYQIILLHYEVKPMHTFQPIPVDMLDMNPFTKIGKEWALLSAGSKQKSNTMTVSWGGVGVLWGKNVIYVFVRDSRYTKELIDEGNFFSLTFLSEKYKDALSYCGSHSGRDENKIAGAGLSVDYRHGIPYIDEGNLVFICEKMSATRITEDSFLNKEIKEKWYKDGDMHTMYIGQIIDVLAR